MTLYDAYGRPVDTGRLGEEQAAPTMTGVRNIYSVMHPSVGLTPEKLSAVLRQAEFGDPFLYLELAEEMEEKDLHYLAVLGTRKQSVAGLQISVSPASGESEDQRIAELVRDLLLGGTLNLRDMIFDILDAIGKGFSATEIIWDTSGPLWRPARLIWRDPRWFAFDWVSGEQLLVRTIGDDTRNGAIAGHNGNSHFRRGFNGYNPAPANGLTNAGPSNEPNLQPMTAALDPFKFIVHISKAKSGLPIRGGVARAAGWSYLFKNYILKDWVTFAEVFGQPLRLGKYGAGATEADKQALLSAVANIGTDAAAIVPDSMLIEFTEARQTGSADLYERFCEYLDRQVSKAILGQTLTTELPRSGGSRAAAQVHDAVRRDILASDARRLSETLTRDLVKPIVDLNAGPQTRYPRIDLILPSDGDEQEFAAIIAGLIDRGLRISQKTVLDRLNLPTASSADATLHPLGWKEPGTLQVPNPADAANDD
jgi:phage gp29-like protein